MRDHSRRLLILLLAAALAAGAAPLRAQSPGAAIKSSSDKALQDLDREEQRAAAAERKPEAPKPKVKKAEAPSPAPAPEPPPAAPAPQAAPADPAQKGLDDARKVLDFVGQGKEAIADIDEKLDAAIEFVKNSPKIQGPDKELYLKKIEEMKEALAGNTQLYTRFADTAGKAKEVLDLVNDVKELKGTMDEYAANQGQGAANLLALAFLADKLGGDVPLLGDAIKAYAEITKGILGATNKLAGSINENQRQGGIGKGGQSTGEKFEALKTLLGETAAKDDTWLPTEPGWIFTTTDGKTPDLLWDQESKSWLQAPKGSAEQVYWKNRLAGKPPSPQFLAALCQPETAQKALEREKAAEEYLKLLDSCAKSLGDEYLAYLSVNEKAGWALRGWLRDPKVFAARFAYDGAFQAEARSALKSLYEELAKKLPADSPLLARLRDWAKTQDLALGGPAAPDVKPEPCWQEAYDYHKQAVDWLPKIHDPNSFAHWSCQPMHSAQESPSKACCDAYYGTRNDKGMWDKAWDILQDCGWKDEIEKRRLALEKRKAACAAKAAPAK
ncbi:MAG: hypothetical protein HY926_02050 [Elusimicrobia bacterium]|nr:hypothetical protein [Elusimicrobiota bacterium]